MNAKVIPFNKSPRKCSFCGRELIEGRDRYMENEANGKIICFKPCIAIAQGIIELDEMKTE